MAIKSAKASKTCAPHSTQHARSADAHAIFNLNNAWARVFIDAEISRLSVPDDQIGMLCFAEKKANGQRAMA